MGEEKAGKERRGRKGGIGESRREKVSRSTEDNEKTNLGEIILMFRDKEYTSRGETCDCRSPIATWILGQATGRVSGKKEWPLLFASDY